MYLLVSAGGLTLSPLSKCIQLDTADLMAPIFDRWILQRTGLETRNLWSLNSLLPQNFKEYLQCFGKTIDQFSLLVSLQHSIETIEFIHYFYIFVTLQALKGECESE